jgi:hypothetical protein
MAETVKKIIQMFRNCELGYSPSRWFLMFFLVEYDILMVLHTHLGQRAHLAN